MTRNISLKYLKEWVFVLFIVGFFSCNNKPQDGMIVFTQIPAEKTETGKSDLNSLVTLQESQIMAINPDQKRNEVLSLTEDFTSAVSPSVSYDGKSMLFSAQKEPGATWQIWHMNLSNRKASQITFFNENCVSPVYLPGGRFVFSRKLNNDTVKTAYTLFTGNLDGTDFRQITFNPNTYLASNILNDGRIITISQQVFPEKNNDKIMVMRPDGTKLELFCEHQRNGKIISRVKETQNGKIVFVESNEGKGDLISVDYNRPLKSNINISSDIEGNFSNVHPSQSGGFLVAFRNNNADNYSLYKLDDETSQLSLIYKKEGFNIGDAVEVIQRERPRNLPSEVNMGVKTGLLMCQDINFYGTELGDNNPEKLKAEKVAIMGIDSTIGVVNVETDGSFYIKILADTPFRLQTLTANGENVSGPGAWMYMRPNERRGCVGCHSGNEISPFNRQPLSVKKDPVFIPKEIEGITEFKVELE